jgi:valyl-tRNA synthetase
VPIPASISPFIPFIKEELWQEHACWMELSSKELPGKGNHYRVIE